MESNDIARIAATRRLYKWCGIAFVCIALPGILVALIMYGSESRSQTPAYFGGYCAICSSIISTLHIMEHLTTFTHPEKQSKIVRILFMVPLYAITSWLSLCFRDVALYFALVRDAYESYALYNFYTLMLELLGGTDALYRLLMSEDRELLPHLFPLYCCFPAFKFSPRFVMICQKCMFQFMIVKPLTTTLVIVMAATGNMGESFLDFTTGYAWTFWIYNISISVALTAVLYFYHATAASLEGQGPLGKFLCIKIVVFLTFWQGVAIQVLVHLGWLPQLEFWTEKEVATGLQDFAICVEMLLCAFAHKVCFGADVYTPRPDAETQELEETGGGDTPRQVTIATLPGASPWVSLIYILRHVDVRRDMWAMLHGR